VAKNKQGIILIIDNNDTNGTYLKTFSTELGGPRWTTIWLRVCDAGMSREGTKSRPDSDYDTVYTIREVATYLDEHLDKMQDAVVFYNAQLGLFQRSGASAEKSEITLKLREFVKQDRRILINLYAANFPVQNVAVHIDPDFKQSPDDAKVICRHSVNDAPPSKVKKIVAETLDEWEQRFMRPVEKSVSR